MTPRWGLAAVMVLIVAAAAVAGEIPRAERRSGYELMSRDTRAMQDDDTANPAMLWVLEGESLWKAKAASAGRACADCHGDARTTMKGVAARHPAFDPARGRPISACGRQRQRLQVRQPLCQAWRRHGRQQVQGHEPTRLARCMRERRRAPNRQPGQQHGSGGQEPAIAAAVTWLCRCRSCCSLHSRTKAREARGGGPPA